MLKNPDLRERVTTLAGERRWQEVCDLLGSVPASQRLAPLVVHSFVVAAVETASNGALAQAVARAIDTELRPALRAQLALRLAFAGHANLAWAVMLADHQVLLDEAARPELLKTLGRLAGTPNADPSLRRAAAALLRRIGGVAQAVRHKSPFAFSIQGRGPSLPARAHPLRIQRAPGLDDSAERTLLELGRDFDEAVTRPDREPGVTELRDVFVNRRGQVWNRDGQLIVHSLNALLEDSRSAMRDAEEVSEAAFAAELTKNFYHFYAEWLPSLAWRLRPGGPSIPVLLSDDGPPFQREALALAAGDGTPLRQAGDAIFVRRLHIGDRGLHFMRYWEAYRDLVAALERNAARKAPTAPAARRIYLSRRDSRARGLENEAELEAAALERGFTPVLFTGRSLAEQIQIIRGADVILAQHGAGLAHLLTARPGTSVFEIMPVNHGAHSLRFNMARLSRIRGHRHTIWLEPFNLVTKSWSVTLEPMLAALDAFCAEIALAA